MAVSYVTQKCTSCAGTKLEYIKEMKAWRCAYCGTLIERHEQADTMFTIKNVVRQTLLDIAYVRMDSARNNLVECEKIDSRYVGTIIAEIAYEMNMVIHGNVSPNEQRNLFAQLKKNYMTLCEMSTEPTEDELVLYEFFDSSEVTGTLILVFDTLKATQRRDALFNFFNAGEVYSVDLNSNLINFAFKNEKYDMLEKIIHNKDNINKIAVTKMVLKAYPDGEKKAELVRFLIGIDNVFSEDDRRMFEDYLETTEDCEETTYNIALALCSSTACPGAECLMKNVVSKLNDTEKVSEIMAAFMQKQLSDVEKGIIVDFAVSRCSQKVCLFIFEKLLEGGQFVEPGYKHFDALLSREDVSADYKTKIIDVALQFNVNDRIKEAFISKYLCEVEDTPENREILTDYLLGKIDALSLNTIEKYIIKCKLDGEEKPTVVKKIFDMNNNMSFFRNTLNDYISSSNDEMSIKKRVIDILTDAGVSASTSTSINLLTQGNLTSDEKIDVLRRLKASGQRYDDVLENYLCEVSENNFDSHILTELLSSASSVTEKAFVRYVMLMKNDSSAARIGNTAKLSNLCYNSTQNIMCRVNHGGNIITCNIIQGYILSSPDKDEETAVSMYGVLNSSGVSLNTEIDVGGSRMKFKKYIAVKKREIEGVTRKLCEEAGIL
jgi:predicted RNA-binding Zn-ribbon protein involved in translation (DUF1610 family)